jgi:anhydro-N-acetylmuramic acid kinase
MPENKTTNKTENKIKTAIGLMSGTSMDGIDVALIKSDGENITEKSINSYYPYNPKIKILLLDLINKPLTSLEKIKQIESEVTQANIDSVLKFLKEHQIKKNQVDLIGFHGQTILHNPKENITWQIGDAQKLASATNINVVADFRKKDILFGGQGAPLVPIYHLALLKEYKKPIIVLNIGGVANITYIEDDQPENLIAFDVCFGGAPMDDLIKEKTGKDFDKNGTLAQKGQIDQTLAEKFLSIDFFSKKPPKSLDRNQFQQILTNFKKLKLEDSLATLSFILSKAIEESLKFLPKKPLEIIICGGGRNNKTIVNNISKTTNIKITNIDDLGINGDSVEAEAFGFLAIRNVLNLPISYPRTTGISLEKHGYQLSQTKRLSSCGGVFYHA